MESAQMEKDLGIERGMEDGEDSGGVAHFSGTAADSSLSKVKERRGKPRVWPEVEVMTAPKAPNAFQIYRKVFFEQVQRELPDLSANDVNKELAERWKVDEENKERFVQFSTFFSDHLKQLKTLEPRVNRLVESNMIIEAHSTKRFEEELDLSDTKTYWEIQNRKFRRSVGHFGSSLAECDRNFIKCWIDYRSENSMEAIQYFKSFFIGPFSLFKLYKNVVELGGFVSVTRQGLWEHVASSFDSVCGEKTCAYLLKMFYFSNLYRMEQDFQVPPRNQPKPRRTLVPSDPMLNRKRKKKSAFHTSQSVYTGNYYSPSGLSTLFTCLISGQNSEIVWALNELMLMSYNQNLPLELESFPQLLDALILILKDTAFPPVLLQKKQRHPNLPNTSTAVLVILSNLTMSRRNSAFIGNHRSCCVCLIRFLSSPNGSLKYIAGDILTRVGYYLILSKNPKCLPELFEWIENALLDNDPDLQYQAAVTLCLFSSRSENASVLASAMPFHIVFHLIALLESSLTKLKVIVACIEGLFHLVRSGERIRIKIAQQSNGMNVMASLLLYDDEDVERLLGDEENEVDVVDVAKRVRRSAAAAFSAMFQVKENSCFFDEFESHIFEASATHFEVAYFLVPVLKKLSR